MPLPSLLVVPGVVRVALAMAALAAAPAPTPAQPADSSPPTSSAVGRALFEQQRYAEVRAALEPVARAEPRNAEAAYYLGRVALVDGNAEEGAKWLRRAVSVDGRVAAYHRWLGRAYAREAIRANKLRAMFMARKIRHEFETAVALDPSDVDGRMDLVQYYLVAPGFAGGSIARAREQASEISRRHAYRGGLALGLVAEHANDPTAAARAYSDAIAQYPDSSAAYYALGNMDLRAKRYDRAAATFERLLIRRPDELGAYYWIGRIGSISGQNLDRSADALRTYLSHPPREGDASLASAHFRLGLVYEKQGKRDQAREEFATTLKLDPGQTEARDALNRVR